MGQAKADMAGYIYRRYAIERMSVPVALMVKSGVLPVPMLPMETTRRPDQCSAGTR